MHAYRKDTDNLHRYAGIAFYIGSLGLIATCAHIVEALTENEILVAKDFNRNAFYEVKEVTCHKKMDFAVGHIDVVDNRFMKPINEKITPFYMGTDVQSFGYVNYGKNNENLNLQYRFFKGYISFLGNKPAPSDRCRTLCELSFPSLAGFSGAPVMLNNSDGLIGMLYGNRDSSIEVYSYSEIKNNGQKYSEKIFRTIEFGMAHTINDIKEFLNDLKIKAFH